MRLGEAYGECFFSGIVGLERLAEAVEDASYSCSCSSGRTTSVEEVSPCSTFNAVATGQVQRSF